ncbi:MAG: serine hydrolase, partial [Trueperaceae bacterium]|nr:serine hydrolase [Trueperaceae bacterium]
VEVTPGWWYAPSMSSAGFLKSTAGDMGKYAELFFGNRPDVLSAESVAAMTHPHVETGGDGRYYGYGLMVQPDYRGRKLVEHGGNIKGVAAYFTMLPEEQLVSVVLNNITGGPTGGMAIAGVNLAIGAPVGEKRVTYVKSDVPSSDVEKMLGHYRSQEGAAIEFARGDDGSVQAKMPTVSLGATPVAEGKLVVELNGDEATAYFRDPGADGYSAVFFGFRVLERFVPEPAAEAA